MFEVEEVRDGLWAIQRVEESETIRCYLLDGVESALLIDSTTTGVGLRETIESLTTKPITLLTTHTDPDHIGGHACFESAYLHPSEYPYYAAYEGEKPSNLHPIWEGDVFDNGAFRLEAILLPGHTSGNLAFLERDKRFLISGDVISTEHLFLCGPGRSLGAYIESMRKLETLRPLFDTLYPAHGELNPSLGLITEYRLAAEAIQAGALTGQEPPFALRNPGALQYTTGKAVIFF